MKQLRELLAEKKKELDRLQQEVQALQIAIGLVGGQENIPEDIGEQSIPQVVAGILEEHGRPMHTRDIYSELHRLGRKKIKKGNLGVLLYRYAQRGRRFYKDMDRPNTYGLLKWKHFERLGEHEHDGLR